MATTIALALALSSGNTTPIDLRRSLTSEAGAQAVSRDLPFIPDSSQAWYWSTHWQRNEQATISEIESGLGMTFASVDDLAAWLDSHAK